jgi:hypothetical protein
MNKSIPFLSFCISLICSTLLSPGCSLIGFGIGAATDSTHPGDQLLVPEQLNNLEKDASVFIRMKDSTLLKGSFLAVAHLNDSLTVEKYKAEFEQWQFRPCEDSLHLPLFGSTVHVLQEGQGIPRHFAGRFEGFDPGVVRLLPNRHKTVIPLRLDRIAEVTDILGNVIATRDDLLAAVQQGAPLSSQFPCKIGIIREFEEEIEIPGDEITQVCLAAEGTAKWTGLAIGIGIDVVVVAISVSIVASELQRNMFKPH